MTLVPLGFKLQDRLGFENLEFSRASSGYLVWPEAVKFAALQDRDFVLQSAREAVAFRVDAAGQDNADLYQATSTAAIYGMFDGKQAVAFYDDADPSKNPVLQSRLGIMTKKDVREVLARAEKAGRIQALPSQNPLELSVRADPSGDSAYGQDPRIRAALGDMAEENARYIAGKKFKVGRLYVPSGLENLSNNQVDVRAVGLGGGGSYDGVDGLVADDLLSNDGVARGVRRVSAKKSP